MTRTQTAKHSSTNALRPAAAGFLDSQIRGLHWPGAATITI